MRYTHTIAIDPSIRRSGYGVLDEEAIPVSAGLVTVGGETNDDGWRERSIIMVDTLLYLIARETHRLEPCIPRIIVEAPEQRGDATGRRSRERESIQKLYFMVGGLLQSLLNFRAPGLWYATPTQWKGRKTKEVVRRQLVQDLAPMTIPTTLPHDTVEAISIGRTLLHSSSAHPTATLLRRLTNLPSHWTIDFKILPAQMGHIETWL